MLAITQCARVRACVRACAVCVCLCDRRFFFLHPPCPRKRHTWLLWCSLMRWTPKRGKSGCFRLFFHEEWTAWWPLLDLAGKHGWASRSIRTFDLQGVRLSLVSALSPSLYNLSTPHKPSSCMIQGAGSVYIVSQITPSASPGTRVRGQFTA